MVNELTNLNVPTDINDNTCSCLCICTQKLLTATSQERGICSGCVIGNCRGKNLLKTFVGGKFEIPDRTKSNFVSFVDLSEAYPFSTEDGVEKEDKEAKSALSSVLIVD
jgi:hypothetical protein